MTPDPIIEELKRIVTKAHEEVEYYDTLFQKDKKKYDQLGIGYVAFKSGQYQGELTVAGRLLTMMITGKKP